MATGTRKEQKVVDDDETLGMMVRSGPVDLIVLLLFGRGVTYVDGG